MRRPPVPAGLLLLLIFTAAAAPEAASPDRWLEVRSAHFILFTDSHEKDARGLANQFERMHSVFHAIFPTQGDDSDPPIHVLAFKDRQGMRALVPEAYLGKNQVDLGGFFLRAPDKNYIVVRLDARQEHPFASVYHEYTHYVLRKNTNWLPLWLNEGLAEFYQNTDIGDKDVRLGQASPCNLRYLAQSRLLPLATLLAVEARSPYYRDQQKGSVFYAESWALTHYLIVTDRNQGTHRVQDYAQFLMQHEDPVTAAQRAFGDLDKLEQALTTYVHQRNFAFFTLPAALSENQSSLQIRAVSIPETDAIRADVLIYTERTKEAQALLDTVLRDDPGNALARETMGSLRFREGDLAAAKKWFGEAVQLDSHSYLAHYYYAAMSFQAGDSGQDAAIESSLLTAIKLNPDFAPSYDALAMFHASRDGNLDQAHMLNLRAVELDPDHLSYRLNQAELLAQDRQFVSAIGVLKDAMRLARTPAEEELVQARLKRIEEYQAALDGEHTSLGSGPDRAHEESTLNR